MRVLGVSPLHDSTVAVINDGKLELFFKEEQISSLQQQLLTESFKLTKSDC
jgi:hypothetical protein